jgi:hypothetical protein
MREYEKIETLYDRSTDFSVDTTKLRLPEFGNVKSWHITEKVDGTNIRIEIAPDGSIHFGGRTENAQIPTALIDYLLRTFTTDRAALAFQIGTDPDKPFAGATLYGEGYGPKIQSGGKYRSDMAVVLFDVLIADKWWLSPESVEDVASKFSINAVTRTAITYVLPVDMADLRSLLGGDGNSTRAYIDSGQRVEAEGIVARAYPMLYLRDGRRCMWKLKFRDFRKGKR